MARRTLSLQGRIAAAGLSVAAAGGLVAVMAAEHHEADAGTTTDPVAATPRDDGASATPYQPGSSSGSQSAPTGDAGSTPRPQTRTGGS
jgi:hypothetical protein